VVKVLNINGKCLLKTVIYHYWSSILRIESVLMAIEVNLSIFEWKGIHQPHWSMNSRTDSSEITAMSYIIIAEAL